MLLGNDCSKTWTFFAEGWHEGNVGIMGPRTHAAWLCSMVFDGARAFEAVSYTHLDVYKRQEVTDPEATVWK